MDDIEDSSDHKILKIEKGKGTSVIELLTLFTILQILILYSLTCEDFISR